MTETPSAADALKNAVDFLEGLRPEKANELATVRMQWFQVEEILRLLRTRAAAPQEVDKTLHDLCRHMIGVFALCDDKWLSINMPGLYHSIIAIKEHIKRNLIGKQG